MRIYIAGPVSGFPLRNAQAFNAEAAHLRAAGHDVVNPAERHAAWPEAGGVARTRRDLATLQTCSAVQLLPGWEMSGGALLAVRAARDLGMTIFYPASTLLGIE
jgi:hypothetical protein